MKVNVLSSDDKFASYLCDGCETSHLSCRTGKLQVASLKNVVFDPTAGLFCDGKFISHSFWVAHNGERLSKLIAAGGFKMPKPVRRFDGRAYYLGVIHTCWGHCLLDCTRFLWPVVAGTVDEDVTLVYSLATDPGHPTPKDIIPNFKELLECAGVRQERMMRIDEPTEFSEMMLADECFSYDHTKLSGHVYTQEARDMFEKIAEMAAPSASLRPSSRTVLLSRAKWTGHASDFGESHVEQCIQRQLGCEVVSPECLSFREQVRILRETEKLITTEGSIAHNAVFLPKGSKIVLLLKAKEYNRYQVMVNDMRQLDVTYIDCNKSDHYYRDNQIWLGPFFMYVSKALATYLGCKEEWPRITRFRYLMAVYLRRIYLLLRI